MRFVPEYDNLLIAHADRNRVISDDDHPKVFLSAARVLRTTLVDGFARGIWKVSKTRRAAKLSITPFGAIATSIRDELMTEGENLLRFVEPNIADYKISLVR